MANEERARQVIRQMLAPSSVEHMESGTAEDGFASEFPRLAFENVYAALWSRPGLALRDRSLLTLGILIAQHAEKEMRSHVAAALRNGVTKEELAEIVYHATGYAGFPAAALARRVAGEVLAEMEDDRKA